MSWGNEVPMAVGNASNASPVSYGAIKTNDDRPELVVVDESLSKSLLMLDEELRLISNSVRALGGDWPNNPRTDGVAPMANHVVGTLRDRADSASRSANLARDLRERLQRIV